VRTTSDLIALAWLLSRQTRAGPFSVILKQAGDPQLMIIYLKSVSEPPL